MSTELDEIRAMQSFLGIREKPSIDERCNPGYDVWLRLHEYAKELKQRCEDKLAREYMRDLGANLFKNKFSSFQEFQR